MSPDGYTSESVKNDDGSITITNRHVPDNPSPYNPSETINIPVKKVWIGPAKDSATVYVMNGDTEVANVKLSEDNGWHYEFTGLPKYDASGNKINYTIKEDAIKGYKAEVKGDTENGFTITNTSTTTTQVRVTKKWAGPALNSVTVNLLADGVQKDIVTLSADNNWTHTFENIPKYDSTDGHEISYTVSEKAVDGYSTAISGTSKDGYTITNTITGKISIPVTKIWSGGTGDKAVVHLFADGTEVALRELNGSNNWQYTFENLDEYKDGKKISYTLTEDTVSGFKATITYADGKGFTVTNAKTTPKTPDKNTPTPGTKAAGGPKTGDTSHIGLWLILMLAALSGLIGNVIYMRKCR